MHSALCLQRKQTITHLDLRNSQSAGSIEKTGIAILLLRKIGDGMETASNGSLAKLRIGLEFRIILNTFRETWRLQIDNLLGSNEKAVNLWLKQTDIQANIDEIRVMNC